MPAWLNLSAVPSAMGARWAVGKSCRRRRRWCPTGDGATREGGGWAHGFSPCFISSSSERQMRPIASNAVPSTSYQAERVHGAHQSIITGSRRRRHQGSSRAHQGSSSAHQGSSGSSRAHQGSSKAHQGSSGAHQGHIEGHQALINAHQRSSRAHLDVGPALACLQASLDGARVKDLRGARGRHGGARGRHGGARGRRGGARERRVAEREGERERGRDGEVLDEASNRQEAAKRRTARGQSL